MSRGRIGAQTGDQPIDLTTARRYGTPRNDSAVAKPNEQAKVPDQVHVAAVRPQPDSFDKQSSEFRTRRALSVPE